MERKIIDYYVISDVDPEEFQNSVVRLIGEGWQPHGSIAICYMPEGEVRSLLAVQAMVKYED